MIPRPIKLQYSVLIFITALITSQICVAKPSEQPQFPSWFNEAKAGLFIHWGLYSIPGDEWEGKRGNRDAHIQHEFRIPVAEYAKLADSFNPVKFDAEAYVKLAKDAGLNYIVYVSKHHDGFAMFDSPSNPFNIVKATPFKRDPLKELAMECRKQGIKLCVYYSLGRDWQVPGVPRRGNRANNWDFPNSTPADFERYMNEKVHPQLRELLTQYGPIGAIWFDTPHQVTRAHSKALRELIKSLQPDCLINSRISNGLGDYDIYEQRVPKKRIDRPWETCLTINKHWGYSRNDHNWKSTALLVRTLVDVASKGGNLLVNIGPTGDGSVPDPSMTRLNELGDWLRLHGESIYGTTASSLKNEISAPIVFAEINADGSEKNPTAAPAAHKDASLPHGWRVTAKPGFLYIHLFDRPENNRLVLSGLSGKVAKAILLTDPKRQELKIDDSDDFSCQLPQGIWDERATVIRLELKEETTVSSAQEPKEVPVLKRNWAERLEYVGLVIEDDDYHIWGSSPIWGDDGKVHIFSARMPVKSGFKYWYATSEIAHYVADKPEGPFTLVEVLLKPGESEPGSWDAGAQHNPTITKIDDLFVLTYHSNQATLKDRARKSHAIGMMTAKSLNGPWKKLGMVLAPPTDASIWSHQHAGGIDNPALIKRSDGKYYLYYRAKFKGLKGDNTYGVAIADKLEGPYKHHPTRVINNPRYVEDPYVFEHNDTVYMLVTDNYKSRGLLLTSQDGLHFEFTEAVPGFGKMADYISPELVKASPNYRGPKFERPQLLMKDGVPTHLYAPGGVNIHGGKGSCCYLFKIRPVDSVE